MTTQLTELRSDNPILNEAFSATMPLLQSWVSQPEVSAAAILSTGGDTSTEEMFDEFSDLDISLIISIPGVERSWDPSPRRFYDSIRGLLPVWLPAFATHIPVSWGQLEINVHQLVLEYERNDEVAWDGEKCDTYARRARWLKDEGGAFARIVQHKNESAAETIPIEALRLANRLTWDMERMPLRQIHRFGPLEAHHCLNFAIDELIAYSFLTNGRFVPNKKWRLHILRTEGVLKPESLSFLPDAMSCLPTSEQSVHDRIAALRSLCLADPALRFLFENAHQIRQEYESYALQLRGSESTVRSAPLVSSDPETV